ncbi:hypothetical protein GCM10025781_27080 [Kocuria gwangalliensis]|uniref:Uncharacterized protein n=1 Tax=Kocuria gwangalliensis TaxID=501592 RepID=A0ABP8XJ84_9MICC
MAKIHLKMVTGEVFTISEAFHGRSGQMPDRQTAEIQMSFILGRYNAINTDQGKTLNTNQIVYEWVEE